MKRVKFLSTVFGVPHVRGTDFTAEAGYIGLVTDEAFQALRDRRSFDNTPWIVSLGAESERGSESADRPASDARNRDSEVVLYATERV